MLQFLLLYYILPIYDKLITINTNHRVNDLAFFTLHDEYSPIDGPDPADDKKSQE